MRLNPLKVPFGKAKFSPVKNVRYVSWQDPFESRILVIAGEVRLMSAGSSPDTGKNSKDFVIPITEPPIVEIDTVTSPEVPPVQVTSSGTVRSTVSPVAAKVGLVRVTIEGAFTF